MLMKRWMITVLLLSILGVLLVERPCYSQENSVSIYYNFTRLSFNQEPVIENGSVLVPLRMIFEQLGAEVRWEAVTKTSTVTKADTRIILQVDKDTALVNDQPVQLEQPIREINGEPFVSLRFAGDTMGARLEMTEAANAIDIFGQEYWTTNVAAGDFFILGLKQADPKQAIMNYNQALQSDPLFCLVYLARGITYNDSGEFDKSITECNLAMTKGINTASLYRCRGSAYAFTGKYELALADLTKAIELYPRYTDAFMDRGMTYRSMGKYDLAINDYDRALTLSPHDVRIYLAKSETYISMGNDEAAAAELTKAPDLGNSAENFVKRAWIYNELGEYEKAIADASKAIEIDRVCDRAYAERAYAYDALRRHNEALVDYTKAIELYIKSAQPGEKPVAGLSMAYNNRGLVFIHLYRYELALEDFNKAIENDLKYWQAYLNRGELYADLWMYSKAMADFKRILEIDPGNPYAQLDLGYMYLYGMGVPADDEAAFQWFLKAAEQGLANAQFDVGLCYYYGWGVPQNITEAVNWMKKAADQGNPYALDFLKGIGK